MWPKKSYTLHMLHNMLLCRNSLNILNWCLFVTNKLKKLVQNSLYRIFSSAFLKNISPWQFPDYCLLCNLIQIIFFTSFLWQDFESLLLNCFGISSSPDAASYHLCRFISISHFSRSWQSNLSSEAHTSRTMKKRLLDRDVTQAHR